MRSVVLLTAAALTLPLDAFACGGFFCNQDFPIDQKGEQIVFGVDDQGGVVTAHVSITYQGASDDFAWVVPVPGEPELFASSDALFTTLSAITEPQFWLQYDTTGVCDFNFGWSEYDMMAGSEDTDAPTDGGVTVVNEERVGPYDTVTLQAESSAELLTWLQAAGYDLPNDLDPVLAPYVASGQYFVALKLSAGNDTGDLVPLGMRYPGTGASIPIQLTSIAATPDMRLEVYVLGDARAVPDNYLHVRINEAAIDWFTAGSNYEETITIAADEAGGHAFATDFSGSTEAFRGRFWNEGQYNLDSLRTLDDPIDWVQGLMNMGFPPSAALLEVFLDLIPFPEELADDITPQNFYDCLSCYSEYIDATGFDGDTATDVLEDRVVEGLRQAEALMEEHEHISRMTSSLDAVEMTLDPMFVFNRDMRQDISNVHQATLQYHCGMAEGWDHAERTLVLSDGREIRLPSEAWVDAHDTTEFEVMGPLTSPAAILIEDLGADGLGTIIFDYRDEAALEARRFRRAGCGCATGLAPATGFLPLFALLGVLVGRRRRS